jgi:hypothetical protein
MSSPLWGEDALAGAFPSGEPATPRVFASRTAQRVSQLGESRERHAGPILARGEMAAPLVQMPLGAT